MTLLVLLIIALLVYYLFISGRSNSRFKFMNNGRKCPNCGNPVENNFNVCPICKETLKKKCPNCGEPVNTSWKYCPFCEHNINRDDAN